MRRGDDLANRLLQFAAAANYAEARGAESRADFVHKLRIADKEARESQYWLSLVAARWDEHATEADELAAEADELVAILTASVRTAVARSTL